MITILLLINAYGKEKYEEMFTVRVVKPHGIQKKIWKENMG